MSNPVGHEGGNIGKIIRTLVPRCSVTSGRGALVGYSNGKVPAGVGDAKQERSYMSRGVPHKPGTGFICKGTPAVPLPVKPPCQRSRVMWGEVSPCQRRAGDQPAVCRARREPSRAPSRRRRGGNDTEALSSNPPGVICTSVSLIDDSWSNARLWK